jgi:hypothetical protein
VGFFLEIAVIYVPDVIFVLANQFVKLAQAGRLKLKVVTHMLISVAQACVAHILKLGMLYRLGQPMQFGFHCEPVREFGIEQCPSRKNGESVTHKRNRAGGYGY